MNDPQLSTDELNHLAAEVDLQLAALREELSSIHTRGGSLNHISAPKSGLPDAPAQRAVIERETGGSFDSFWQKYLHHARRDLCLPGGMLYEQWQKWRDMESGAAVRVSYGWLAAMGIPAGSLSPLAVAVAVFTINAAVKIGIDAMCEGCEEEGSNPVTPPTR